MLRNRKNDRIGLTSNQGRREGEASSSLHESFDSEITMATPKRLNFSSSDDTCPSSRRKSASKFQGSSASDAVAKEEPKKKKKKLASSNRIWNEDDELALLKGLVDYRVKTLHDPNPDWDGFFNFIHAKVSKEQLLSKIRMLKRKFLVNMERIIQGNDPLFTRSTDSQAFGYSSMIWDQNEAQFTANEKALQIENGEEMFNEDEQVDNAELVNYNGVEKSKFDGKSPYEVVVFKTTEYMTAGKESHDNDAAGADEFCAVRDAFETMITQGLSGYQKKFQLDKLMNLGTGKRKELSNEWNALCAEEVRLNIKKIRFSAKLAEAANDR